MKQKKQAEVAELFALDEKASVPIWLQLKNRFIYLITSGHYLPGDKLPTVRSMAADIEINYNTVSKVYKSLEEDGYIESHHRQGVFVCDVSDKPGVSLAVTAEMVTMEYIQRCQELGLSLTEISSLFNEAVMKIKVKRNKEQGDNDASQKQRKEVDSNIIHFPRLSDDECSSAGNGA